MYNGALSYAYNVEYNPTNNCFKETRAHYMPKLLNNFSSEFHCFHLFLSLCNSGWNHPEPHTDFIGWSSNYI